MKLRLILHEKCKKKCEGCCNKDWNIPMLPINNGYLGYEEILLTGGEPFLTPKLLKKVITEIRKETNTPIYIYTAEPNYNVFFEILNLVDGICFTIHDNFELKKFKQIDIGLSIRRINKSMRLNIFKDIEIGELKYGGWKIKKDIEWIKNCPLPAGEILKRYG